MDVGADLHVCVLADRAAALRNFGYVKRFLSNVHDNNYASAGLQNPGQPHAAIYLARRHSFKLKLERQRCGAASLQYSAQLTKQLVD